MKKGILNLINRLYKYSDLHKSIKELRKHTDWQHKEAQCLQYLLHFMGNHPFLPTTRMSMSPVTICHILNEIVINNRQTIIEFGAGNSTIYISKLASTLTRKVDFCCVESDEKWIAIVQSYLAERGLQQHVQFIHAPIVEQHFDAAISPTFKWYDSAILKQHIASKQFDLMVVDGPQGNLCSFSRYPAVWVMKEFLSSSYAIFLDDADRKDERFIYEQWCKLLNKKSPATQNSYATIFSNNCYLSEPK